MHVVEHTDRAVACAGDVPPRMRGRLHLGSFPLVVSAGIVLVCLAPDGAARACSAVFGLSAALNFAASAALHWRGRPDESFVRVLRRLDQVSIFVLIAGSITAFAVLLLGRADERVVLGLVWGVAFVGTVFRLAWPAAPRWLYTLVYCLMGCAAAFWIRDFALAGGAAVVVLLATGGVLYLLGGFVYGTRWPNPSARWFGFHEVFHGLTVMGFAAHYTALSILVYGRR
jgi:hemolysin III